MPRYLGLDVHARSTTAVILDGRGREVSSHVLETNGRALIELLKLQPKDTHVCLEEGTQSQWLYEILRPHAKSVVVTVPEKRQGNKSDKADARALADALRTGKLTVRVYKDDGKLTKLRELARVYSMAVRDSTRTQNRIKSFFRSRGILIGDVSLEDEERRADWLARVPAAMRDAIGALFQQYDAQIPIRARCEDLLSAEAKRHRAYRWISSVPGLGPIRTARVIAVVITPTRFPHREQFWQYVGLGVVTRITGEWKPSQDGGWEKSRAPQTLGLNHNHNHVLKDVFKGAAKTIITNMPGSPLRKDFSRMVASGTKTKLAELTLARKIAAITLAVWKREEVYDPKKGCTR